MNYFMSIVLPVWNNAGYLKDLIPTLKEKTKVAYELIVVDQGSTDGSQDIIGIEFPNCKFIQNTKNTGSTGAWNQGIRASSIATELVLLLNSDIRVLEDGWLEKFQTVIKDRMDDIGIVECLEVIWDGSTRWAGAACPLINKRMVRDIGFFDEKNFWGFCGDTDYWIRAIWHKWQMGWCRDVLIYHDCGGTHRRGILRESANKDWEEGKRVLHQKWPTQVIHDGWNGPRAEQELWLKTARQAGRLT